MKVIQKIKNVLRGLEQRWGSSRLKRRLWDKEYQSGKWRHCEFTPGAYVYDVVERYCCNGSILDLGCGAGNTGTEIDTNKYHDYTGVDISEVALHKARQRSEDNGRAAKNRYVCADIMGFVPDLTYDVILLRESIYYIPNSQIKALIDHYLKYLKDQTGVFVVNASQSGSKRFLEIRELLEANYNIVEKLETEAEDSYVLVFR